MIGSKNIDLYPLLKVIGHITFTNENKLTGEDMFTLRPYNNYTYYNTLSFPTNNMEDVLPYHSDYRGEVFIKSKGDKFEYTVHKKGKGIRKEKGRMKGFGLTRQMAIQKAMDCLRF